MKLYVHEFGFRTMFTVRDINKKMFTEGGCDITELNV
jgi:hypothetical protein